MSEAHSRLLEQRLVLEEEKLREEGVVMETSALLEKVDQRRREHPEDRRRWDSRANDLEEALLEGRRRLGVTRQRIVDIKRKIETQRSTGGAAEDAEAESAESTSKVGDALPDSPGEIALDKRAEAQRNETATRIREATRRVLSAPRFKLQELPLEDFVLAKMSLDPKAAAPLNRTQADELKQRIKIYDRSVERQRREPRSGPSPEERRQQMVIRKAIEKCRTNQLGSLTLHEIDILIGCYDLVTQKSDANGEDDRLVELINDAIDRICSTWSQMEKLREAMSVRAEE